MTEPRDIDGEPVRQGEYLRCPLCDVLIRHPIQDVPAEQLARLTVTGGLAFTPLHAYLLRQLEDRVVRHVEGEHTVLEAFEKLQRVRTELEHALRWKQDVLEAVAK